MFETYVNLELANPLTKHTLLVFGQIQDVLNTSRNLVSRSSIEAFKSVQENKFRMQNH